MPACLQLLNKLADGAFHSGEVLAGELGVTRAAIWKQLKKIEAMGLAVDAIRGKGYRLQQPLDLLDIGKIMQQLPARIDTEIARIELFAGIDSTNRYLMNETQQQAGALICLAEAQSQGRGRRGRQWVSPFASNIYMSLKWQYADGPMLLSGLSLALGVAVMRVLSDYGCQDIGLKWPNDIFWRDRKLGGILVELAGDVSGPCDVVAGLGMNVRMPEDADRDIGQPWIDLQHILDTDMPSRNELVARLIEQLLDVLCLYPQQGFAFYQQEWHRWDIARGKTVCLSFPTGEKQGIVQGVDANGALLLDTGQGVETINSGEISLRVQS
jgi:BirA family biotin operon repressor/biotin-[acetyl-CoA-carboxylase] ligase